MLSMFRKEKRANKILVLIDFENLQRNIEVSLFPEKFSMIVGFDRVIRQISQEIGEIINVFVFMPPQPAYLYGETFYQEGFYTIVCPKIRDKKGEERDTTDEIITNFGSKMIDQIPDLTHLCLGSGDKDFSPLVRSAIRKGLKIIIVAGSISSLSSDLIRLVDINPDTKKKMVYLFSPTEE